MERSRALFDPTRNTSVHPARPQAPRAQAWSLLSRAVPGSLFKLNTGSPAAFPCQRSLRIIGTSSLALAHVLALPVMSGPPFTGKSGPFFQLLTDFSHTASREIYLIEAQQPTETEALSMKLLSPW